MRWFKGNCATAQSWTRIAPSAADLVGQEPQHDQPGRHSQQPRNYIAHPATPLGRQTGRQRRLDYRHTKAVTERAESTAVVGINVAGRPQRKSNPIFRRPSTRWSGVAADLENVTPPFAAGARIACGDFPIPAGAAAGSEISERPAKRSSTSSGSRITAGSRKKNSSGLQGSIAPPASRQRHSPF